MNLPEEPDWDTLDVPAECINCRWCRGRCMYCEWVEDWHGRGVVVRIGSLCNESDHLPEKDDARTNGYQPMADAIREWNEMNR